MSNFGSTLRLVCETSSTMPTVKLLRGAGLASSSNTAFAIAGLKSFDDSP